MEIEEEKCQFCGRQAKHYAFAAFVCDSMDCMDKAILERGGPGGHMKAKKHQAMVAFEEEIEKAEKE
jgi:hypothetical protein